MDKKTLNLLKGAGSTLQLFPPSSSSAQIFARKPTPPKEIMEQAWTTVGQRIFKAMQQVGNEPRNY